MVCKPTKMIKGSPKLDFLKEYYKKYQSFTGLLSYSWLSILLRIAFNILVGIIVVRFLIYFSQNQDLAIEVQIFDYLLLTFALIVLSEFLFVSDHILEYFLPIPKSLILRIFIQSVIGLLAIFSVYYILVNLIKRFSEIPEVIQSLGLMIGIIFTAMYSIILLMLRMTQKWIQSQKEIDIMKQEKLKMDYNSLQDKLNPHFLFNNLSVLKSLIIYDQNTAVKFTEDFTDVYRYVLESKENVLVSLAHELEFINAYLGLHKERLGKGLEVKMSIDKSSLQKELAPLTLQLLVENAIKHNSVSKNKPLVIEIISKDDYIGVINSLQLKESSYSTKTGLKNLILRYRMISEKEVEIMESDTEFMVKIPLV